MGDADARVARENVPSRDLASRESRDVTHCHIAL